MRTSTIRMLVTAGLALAAVACGGSENNEPFLPPENDAGPDAANRKRRRDAGLPDQFVPDQSVPDAPVPTQFLAAVAGTDYVNPGVVRLFHLDAMEFDPDFSLMVGSDPVLRGFQNPAPTFAAVNRSAGNSFQTVDAVTGASSAPVATGAGSNPWDLVLVGAYAYVARYDLGDVAKIHRESGAIEAVIELTDLVANDPRPAAETGRMMVPCSGEIAVALQNLNPDFSVDSPGVVAIIDPALDEIVRNFDVGFNPAALSVSESRGRLYSVHTGSYLDPVNFPASVWEIDPVTGNYTEIDLNGVALGNPSDIAVSEMTGYVAGSWPTAAFVFSLDERRFTGEIAFQSEGFASEIALAGARLLAVDGAGLWVKDPDRAEPFGPYAMAYPTVSVAVAEVPVR